MSMNLHARETVLVVGAAGFIGSRVVEALLRHGSYRPIPLVRTTARAAWSDLAVTKCDATSRAELADALQGVDLVVNCVGSDPRTMVAATTALCNAARRNPPRRIVHLSSMAVYGGAQGLVDEQARPEPPLNGYARAKIGCEALVQEYVADGGDAVIIRPTCVFGPESQAWAVRIARLLLARRLGDLGALGDGVCNLVHVDDLAALVVASLAASNVSGEAFNATADGPRPTWNEFLIQFARALGAIPVERFSARRMRLESNIVAPVLRFGTIAARATGASRFVPDAIPCSLLRLWRQGIIVSNVKSSITLGATHRPLEQAIEETVAWWRARKRQQTLVAGHYLIGSAG
jgi:nucleoside-diphosphate-sugar epimerase